MACEQGNAEVSVDVGSERQTVELVTVDGAKKWFVVAVEWGQDEDGEFSVAEARLRLATAEDLVADGIGA